MIEKYGQEIADEQAKHSNIDYELTWIPKFLKEIDTQDHAPDLSEIFKYLDDGYLVIASVNYKSLHNQTGYSGHSVVVIGYDKNNIYLNEPGRPGIQNWPITHNQFIKGWSYPDASANNLTALRPKYA